MFFLIVFRFLVQCIVIQFNFHRAMASHVLGSVGEFDPNSEIFTVYCERLEQFFVANNIGHCPADASPETITAADKRKVAVMISIIGKDTYGVLRDLCSPGNPKDKTFKELCEILQQHFKPKRLEVAESYRFHRCFQEENESISEYSARLRHLASTCNFGEFLNRSLRDQFVCGVRNQATRKKLLSEDRNFQQALKVAIADETAGKETLQVEQQSQLNIISKAKTSSVSSPTAGTSRVQPISRQSARQSSQPVSHQTTSYTCFSCGKADHVRSKCKFRNAICRSCNARGHIARVCKKSGVNILSAGEDFEPLDEETELYTVYDVNAITRSEISIDLKIENNICSMQLDTGCALSLAPLSVFKKICPNVDTNRQR